MSPWSEPMRLATLVTVLMLTACSGLATGPERKGQALLAPLRSASIALPVDDAQFTGAGADILNRNCLACHSSTMVSYQPKLTNAQWHDIVVKMKNAYHAPIADEDVPELVERLTALK